MELAGGIASILTLIEATGVLAKVSRDLVLRWRDAPHQIQALATQLSLLAAELQSIQNATTRSHPVLTDAIIRQSLSNLLTDVRKRLNKLESLHFRLIQHGPVRQKVQWTIKDAGAVDKMLSKTQEVEQRLANLMTLMMLRGQTPVLEGIDRIELMMSTFITAQAALVLPETASPPLPVTTSSAPSQSTSKTVARRVLANKPWEAGKAWKSWGFRGTLMTTKKGPHTDYNIDFTVSLPLARILGSYALKGSLTLRSTPLCRNTFTFRHPSYFGVARVIGYDHPFMNACREGDLETVRSMLCSGDGRPTDMTADGYTPLWYAVLNTSQSQLEVVKEFLDYGFEVDTQVCFTMLTLLELAVWRKNADLTRMLLHRGASQDHVDLYGERILTLCWYYPLIEANSNEAKPIDVFNLLNDSEDQDLNAVNCCGETSLHQAAEHLDGFHIDTLIRLGGDVHVEDFRGNFPIWFACWSGNYSTYSALSLHYDEGFFTVERYSQLGLLHAVVYGKAVSTSCNSGTEGWRKQYDEVLEDLLKRGYNRHIRHTTREINYSDLADDVNGHHLTAHELAAAFWPAIEAWYLTWLRRYGLLETGEHVKRLCDLEEAGHSTHGFVYDCDDTIGEAPSQSDADGSGEDQRSVDGSDIRGQGNERVGDCEEGSEAEDIDQFWDAEED